MKQLMMLIIAAVVFGGSAIAQESKQVMTKEKAPSTWQGYLVDAASAQAMLKSPESAMKSASEYTRETAMKEANRTSGYGILTGGKWLRFDEAGNTKAAEFLKTTDQVKGILVTISGSLNGDELAVESIKANSPAVPPEAR